MDKDVCRARMDAMWARAREEALGVMERARVGAIISGTEWPLRALFQDLARGCVEVMVQGRVDELDQTPGGAFSPSGRPAAGAGAA